MSEYTEKEINAKFFTLPGWFLMYAPLKVPYTTLVQKATDAGYEVKGDLGFWEKGSFLGRGFIGIEVVSGDMDAKNIKELKGTFTLYEHVGPYKGLGKAFAKIKKDYPNIQEFYTFYPDNPEVVEESKLRSWIAFR